MDYTVVGFFNERDDAAQASEMLNDNGFSESEIDISPFSTQGDYTGDDYEYEEEKETSGFWESLFGGDDDDDDRKRHSRAGARNHVVTVHVTDRAKADRAVGILDGCGALDISEEDDMIASRRTMGTGPNLEPGLDRDQDLSDNIDLDHDGEGTISVIKEDLEVGKREVETGGARVRSRIVERPVEENVRLRKERVYVTRKPVDREITAAEAADFRDETIEMTEHAEKAVVEKTAHVVEEISINKDVDVEEETIRETVRETEIEIDESESQKDKRKRDPNIGDRYEDEDIEI